MSATNKQKKFSNHNLKILSNIGDALSSAGSPKTAFARALDILREEAQFRRSFVVLFHAANEKLQPFAANGFTINEFRRLETRAEKSFIGTVFQSGKPVIIPRTSLEPTFAAAFENKNELETSCVCVPIFLNGRTLGAFGAEFEYDSRREDYTSATEFLSVVAVMIAQTIKVERTIAAEKERLQFENNEQKRLLREKYDFGQLVGNSSAMRRVFDQVAQVARTNTPVLLRGESGTGKELIANAIHYNSLRSKKPFVKVNCAALPENLIEIELFGQESKNIRKGKIETAEGGTLVLDEIADLPLQTQARLLRVLETREFERVNGGATLKANVRLVATTTKNLEESIAAGDFREDLFYRLSVFTIFLPPLRERKADILLLAEHFVEKYEREHGKHIKRISTPAIDMLASYHFPGNVRELENVVERAVIVCDSNVIHGHHLPPTLQTADVTGTITRVSLESAVEAFERDLIQDALKTTRGNCSKAAKLLDTTERIFSYKVKKYNIEPRRFRI
jgi:Nif-specific regulatory protein